MTAGSGPAADTTAVVTPRPVPGPPAGRRTVLRLARAEAAMLGRGPLVLAGLLAGAILIWILIAALQPLWWRASWDIGSGQVVLGMAVLVSAQLAAGRARRDGMTDLYASFPVSPGRRTLAHLAGLAGAVPASVLLAGAGAAFVQSRGAIGTANIAVLASGVLLVVTAGAAGTALGTRFAHPLAGVIGALVLLITSVTTHLASGAGIWLLPWEIHQDQLAFLPGSLPGYPPVAGHALELASLAALAGIAALVVTSSRARPRATLALAGLLAVALTGVAGVVQFQPIPAASLNRLVTQIADPPAGQKCTAVNRVRYCLYPAFGRDLRPLEPPVNGVLAHLPARPAEPLAIEQTIFPSLDPTLTHGHPQAQVSSWLARARRAPANGITEPAVYLTVGSWPATSGQLSAARFQIALAAADWAVRLPFPVGNGMSCVPFGQARAAIAIWLALQAVHGSPGEFSGGLSGPHGLPPFTVVSNTTVATWNYPGLGEGSLTGQLPQYTAADYLLANAMLGRPARTVTGVLAGSWNRWLNPRVTDAQLAAALGIKMPPTPTPAAGARIVGPAPESAVCR
jgi:hypothetical protein